MKPFIEKYQNKQEYYFQEGCFITELSNSIHDKDVSVAQAIVKPGVSTKRHKIQFTTERYVIISGTGIVEVEGLPEQIVTKGDVVIIPPNFAQKITNTSTEDLVFFAICSPRFLLENYIEV